MNKSYTNKIIISLLLLLVLSYLFFYSAIGYYNRFQTDDLSFASMINEYGFWQTVQNFYFNWEFNLTTILLFFVLDMSQHINLFFVTTGILLLNAICLYPLLRESFRFLSLPFEKWLTGLLALAIMCLHYLSNRAQGGVTYWITAQVAYAVPFCFLFLGLFFSMRKGKLSLLLACTCLFLFAHSRLNYDASFSAIYMVFALYRYRLTREFDIKRHLPFICFLLGIITCILVPGTFKRFTVQGVTTTGESLNFWLFIHGYWVALKHFASTFSHNLYWIICCILFFFVGTYFKGTFKSFYSRFPGIIWFIITSALLALLANTIVTIVALKTPIGYGRIFFFLDFYFLLVFFFFFSWLGMYLKLQQFLLKNLLVGSISFLLVYVIVQGSKNKVLAKNFAYSYDKRIRLLVANNNKIRNGKSLYLNPLPSSGVLDIPEIGKEDTVTKFIPYTNYSLKKYYNLGFNVFLIP